MNTLDYYSDELIVKLIDKQVLSIKNFQDAEDCRQEIWAELYDFMPLDKEEASRLIERVGRKFRRSTHRIETHEVSYADAALYENLDPLYS